MKNTRLNNFSLSRLKIIPLFLRTAIYSLVGYRISRLAAAEREQTDRLEGTCSRLAENAAIQEQLALARERSRLAVEMYDALAHSLSAIAVQLEAVSALWESDPSKGREILAQSLELTRASLSETRRAIQALRLAPTDAISSIRETIKDN